MKFSAKTGNGLKLLSFIQNDQSWLFNWVLNTPLITLQQNMYSPKTLSFHLFYYLIGMTDILLISPNQIFYMFISCVNCLMLRNNNRSYALKACVRYILLNFYFDVAMADASLHLLLQVKRGQQFP